MWQTKFRLFAILPDGSEDCLGYFLTEEEALKEKAFIERYPDEDNAYNRPIHIQRVQCQTMVFNSSKHKIRRD